MSHWAGGNKDILLGMPGYGELTAGASRGFWRACDKPNRIDFRYNEGSLLAANFNNLWCAALNLAHEGRAPKYFAMQHADVEPEDFWLDKLIDEMEASDFDVLGVPVPIKDPHGLTSTALARPDGDTWRVHCRLTMQELQRLPETFTTEDLGFPLLLNTGLWVCKFDLAWAKKVHFTINDRIVFDVPKNRYVPQTEPEDWFFSRLCHELGLKIGCTRKIAVAHVGKMRWLNTAVYGDAFDEAYVDESVLGEDKNGNWFPSEAVGWLNEGEGEELRRLAADKMVLEIGAYCGRSTICLAKDAKQVCTVDTFDGRGTPADGNTLTIFRKNIQRHGVQDRVRELVGESSVVLPNLPAIFDLAFIDGSHDYDSVCRDIGLAANCLKSGGVLAFHDYESNEPGVTAAVDELIAGGGVLIGRVESLAVVRPPALVLETVNG